MTSLDAPDWERIVTTVQAAGDVPDAPDWQRLVVGPGGTPVGGGGGVLADMSTPGDGYVPIDGGSGLFQQMVSFNGGAWTFSPTVASGRNMWALISTNVYTSGSVSIPALLFQFALGVGRPPLGSHASFVFFENFDGNAVSFTTLVPITAPSANPVLDVWVTTNGAYSGVTFNFSGQSTPYPAVGVLLG